MNQENYWESFRSSGSVMDYLRYRSSASAGVATEHDDQIEQFRQKQDGEKISGTAQCEGNGTLGNAYR